MLYVKVEHVTAAKNCTSFWKLKVKNVKVYNVHLKISDAV